MTLHPECGAPVEFTAGVVLDPDGAAHLCRDYVAWHLPADPRHPDDIPSEFDAVPPWRALMAMLHPAI